MRCPVCESSTLVISSREGIEIDHCPDCRGVWLDRGELDKIIERAAPSVVGAAMGRGGGEDRDGSERERDRRDDRQDGDSRRYDDERYDDRSRKRRKRSSFLEDLFDFD
jgi:Zn-finger nucleic acid-binding protein